MAAAAPGRPRRGPPGPALTPPGPPGTGASSAVGLAAGGTPVPRVLQGRTAASVPRTPTRRGPPRARHCPHPTAALPRWLSHWHPGPCRARSRTAPAGSDPAGGRPPGGSDQPAGGPQPGPTKRRACGGSARGAARGRPGPRRGRPRLRAAPEPAGRGSGPAPGSARAPVDQRPESRDDPGHTRLAGRSLSSSSRSAPPPGPGCAVCRSARTPAGRRAAGEVAGQLLLVLAVEPLTEREKRQSIGVQVPHRPPPICSAAGRAPV